MEIELVLVTQTNFSPWDKIEFHDYSAELPQPLIWPGLKEDYELKTGWN